jgi:4-amino-4-deoxy-L-arabinose transferase-like glycosyltransferase
MEYYYAMKTNKSFNKSMLILILLAVFTGAFAYRGVVDVDIMEARNFVAAREMAQGGSLLIPTMNGHLRLAKPPLPTWLTAAAVAFAGTDNDMSDIRIPAALAGVLMLAGAFLFARNISGSSGAGVYSLLVLSTSFLFMLMARKNTWDIYAHAFMLSGLASLTYAQRDDVKDPIYFYAFAGVMFAASFMSKGPVSFYTVLLPFLVAGALTFSPVVFIRRYYGRIFLCVAVTAVLSALWPVYVYVHETHAVLNVLSEESTAWVSRHMKPFWYYVQFPVMLGLWSVVLIPLLYPRFVFKRVNPVRAKFYLIWIFTAVLLLSVIPEKKDRYLLPVVIPSALLVGEYLAAVVKSARAERADRYILGIWAYASLAIFVCAVGGALFMQITKGGSSWLRFIVLWGVSAAVLFFTLSSVRKYGAIGSVPHVIAVICLAFLLAVPYVKIPEQDFRILEKVRSDSALAQQKIVYGDLSIKEIWALGLQARPLSELSDDSADAVFVTSAQNDVPEGFEGNRIAAYSSKDGRSWVFYRIGIRDSELKDMIIAHHTAIVEDEQ